MTELRFELPDSLVDQIAERVVERLRPQLAASASPARWMSTAEAAEYLGMSANALHKLTSAREIPFSQDAPGGKCWFKSDELDEWRRARSR